MSKTDETTLPEDLADVKIMVDIHVKAREVDEAKERLATLVNECNMLVLEAVDNGEPYRDIAAAAGRSLGWVNTALTAVGAEGPRVRRRPARLREAASKNGTKKSTKK